MLVSVTSMPEEVPDMPDLLTCLNGHQWEPRNDGVGSPSGMADTCPQCGAAGGASPGKRPVMDPTVTLDLSQDELRVPGNEACGESGAGAERLAPPQSESGPPRIPGYEIVGPLASGGMGVVFEAVQQRLGRRVALKMIGPDLTASPTAVERFRREATATASLDHPYIVPIYEVGEAHGRHFFSMKLLGGGDLRQRLPHLTDHPREAVLLLLKVAEAVHYAHLHDIIHRDLKPANILFDHKGEPYVTDFGLALSQESGSILGTPSYMAPEQAQGRFEEIGPATDVYALGCILYEMLTGSLPFRGETVEHTISQVLGRPPQPPGALNPRVSPELEAICLKCLAKEPPRRYATAGALVEDLRRFLHGTPLGVSSRQGPGWLRGLAHRLQRAWGRTPAASVPDTRVWGKSTGLLQTLLRGTSDGVIVADARGQIVLANPAAEAILGPDLARIALDQWAERHHCRLPDGVTPYPPQDLPLARALRGETTTEAEVLVRPSEQVPGIWLSVSAWPLGPENEVPGGGMVVFRDITRRKILHGSEPLYQSLVDTLRLCVFCKDLHGRYTFANRLLCATLGKALEEVLGRTDLDFYAPAQAEKYRHDDARVFQTGQIIEDLEEHLTSACLPGCRCSMPEGGSGIDDAATDGRRYIQTVLAPVYDGEGRPVGTQGAFWDITARKKAERQLEQTAAELKRANTELVRSNAELEQFAYVASHDLQEPLRMVASYTQLLKRRYHGRLDTDADDFIAFAVDGATRMQGLINDLLSYSRVSTRGKQLEVTDCAAVFARAVANLQAAIHESGAQVTHDSLPTVRGDATQLVQLFQNLIGNAIKFRSQQPPVVRVKSRKAHGEWLFAVRDNGIGIDPRHAERIFAIFQRLHPRDQYPGSGIGLAICKKIVERHGGRIWVEPRIRGGSVFYFTIRA
jgi:serine/threonine protein kinase/signal transduction histidine kinase